MPAFQLLHTLWDRLSQRTRTVHRVPRILVVDDDADILASLAPLLGSMLDMPVEVSTASSGIEAVRRFEAGERFDLVLTDERMPGMTGSELLTWLRSHQPGTSRVLMTAYGEAFAGRDAAAARGAEAFFKKPLDLAALTSRLRELLAPE